MQCKPWRTSLQKHTKWFELLCCDSFASQSLHQRLRNQWRSPWDMRKMTQACHGSGAMWRCMQVLLNDTNYAVTMQHVSLSSFSEAEVQRLMNKGSFKLFGGALAGGTWYAPSKPCSHTTETHFYKMQIGAGWEFGNDVFWMMQRVRAAKLVWFQHPFSQCVGQRHACI